MCIAETDIFIEIIQQNYHFYKLLKRVDQLNYFFRKHIFKLRMKKIDRDFVGVASNFLLI